MDMDLAEGKRIHFVGIKGIAMTTLAVWATERGMHVTGSDVSEAFPSDPILKDVGIVPFVGFAAAHVSEVDEKPDVVIYTGAHGGSTNEEVREAQRFGIPTLPHGKALGMAMKGKKQISVAGSHGKTTTSSMVAAILKHAKKDASYAIGSGEIRGLGLPGHAGKGEYFVAEADEYVTDPLHDATPRFLWQEPNILVVTNIDFDHPDVYASLEAVQGAFVTLQDRQPAGGIAIVNADDSPSAVLRGRSDRTVATYGRSSDAMYRITDEVFTTGKSEFTLQYAGKPVARFILEVPGLHNVGNAAAAAIAAMHAGVSWEDCVTGLAPFGGAKRRFERIGEKDGTVYYDDYAHHPKEIEATLASARAWYPDHTIVAVFQPHTYSRTKALLRDFGQAFGDADVVLCTDIYASARETDTHEITGNSLFDELRKQHAAVIYTPGKDDIVQVLRMRKRSPAVVLFMGAGSIYSWENDIVRQA